METTERAYRAIFFDLDGTLLPMEIEEFLKGYFTSLAAFVAARGFDAQTFSAAVSAGVKAMIKSPSDQTNDQAFWETFFSFVDRDAANWAALLDHYYETEFGKLGATCGNDPNVARAVRALVNKGYPLIVATMPLFPPRAVVWRLQWAGLDANDFVRITTYDNSTSVKPKPAYCAENLAACGLSGKDVLMVGNNTLEDMSFAGLGCDMYIVTDNLLDPVSFPLETVKHGTRADFAVWAEALPVCVNPAVGINPAAVTPADTQVALAANYRLAVEDEQRVMAAFAASYTPRTGASWVADAAGQEA
ncbi:HAD family hydrolase [Adlercreutzia sp. ZJ141]|uniref:HAD family hydrolase n=1 Tax=Adlercreutzia sp. ZJ141 TaxID=2709406 RepID=UPI0013EC1224|nr:HAD family hydrolase [Adlercreutzia sp. ZJ141]